MRVRAALKGDTSTALVTFLWMKAQLKAGGSWNQRKS